MKVHPEDKTGDCYKRGLRAEDLFRELMESGGFETRDPTTYEDTRLHIDRIVFEGEEEITYQVKGLRKFFRRNKGYNNSHALLEVSKNQGKKDGTLYTTQAEYMVFCRKGEFIIFKTEDIRDFAEKNLKFGESVGFKDYENFKMKLRRSRGWGGGQNRLEELTIIPYSLLMESLEHEVIEHGEYLDYPEHKI